MSPRRAGRRARRARVTLASGGFGVLALSAALARSVEEVLNIATAIGVGLVLLYGAARGIYGAFIEWQISEECRASFRQNGGTVADVARKGAPREP